jgi:hypothetical protein
VARPAKNWTRYVDPEQYLDQKFREIGFDYGGKLAIPNAIEHLARRLVAAE